MRKVALHPRISVFHNRLNATLVVGRHQDKHVIARMAIPELDGTQQEAFEIIYEAETADAADARLLAIIQGRAEIALL